VKLQYLTGFLTFSRGWILNPRRQINSANVLVDSVVNKPGYRATGPVSNSVALFTPRPRKTMASPTYWISKGMAGMVPSNCRRRAASLASGRST
jgi:hypothetical protein